MQEPVGSSRLANWMQVLAPLVPRQVAAPDGSCASVDSLLLTVARRAMACEFEVLLNREQYPQGVERAMEALDLIDQLEELLSVYRPRSELSTVNRFGSQRPQTLSHDTARLLELALDLYKETGGAFDVTSGSLTHAWGFSRRQGVIPSEADIKLALEQVGSCKLQFDAEKREIRLLQEGLTINPGGIGKGYALDRAGFLLQEAGVDDFMIHGGLSSIVARGNRQHSSAGGGWLVAVKHPWRDEEVLGRVRVMDQAVGTSGSGKQFFHFDGKRYSHIIDPRSGWPAQAMMSTTVLCRSGAVADALATAFFVMGPEESRRFCAVHNEIGAVLVYRDSKKGRTEVETLNLSDESWIPIVTNS